MTSNHYFVITAENSRQDSHPFRRTLGKFSKKKSWIFFPNNPLVWMPANVPRRWHADPFHSGKRYLTNRLTSANILAATKLTNDVRQKWYVIFNEWGKYNSSSANRVPAKQWCFTHFWLLLDCCISKLMWLVCSSGFCKFSLFIFPLELSIFCWLPPTTSILVRTK